MITELTDAQTAAIPAHVKKYVAIGLSTDRIDHEKAKAYAKRLHAALGRPDPIVVIMPGPAAAWAATLMLHTIENQDDQPTIESQVWSQIGSQIGTKAWLQAHSQVRSQVDSQVDPQVQSQVQSKVWSQFGSKVWSQVRSQVQSQVHSKVWSQFGSKVWSQVDPQVQSQVHSQVVSQVKSQVYSQVRSQVESQAQNLIWPYFDGQFIVYWGVWHSFWNDIVGLKDFNIINIDLLTDCMEFGNIYPLQHFCIISDRMSECRRNAAGILHCDGKPAIEYLDGTKVWALNGVSVPQWLAEQKHHEIDCSLFSTIENAEVRREFIRKVGVERLCVEVGAELIHKRGDYELLLVDLKGETGKWPYLKMLNPSVGVWHVEAVDKECRTVEQALAWRNQSDTEPEELT